MMGCLGFVSSQLPHLYDRLLGSMELHFSLCIAATWIVVFMGLHACTPTCTVYLVSIAAEVFLYVIRLC